MIDVGQERYQMTWPGKRESVVLANASTTDTLRPCREESVDFDNTQNLYIEGDNLTVLKLLRETYLGKVKMIYIDPPYNTGNDFIYKDNFAVKSEEWREQSGDYDGQGNRLVKNLESNGRYHSDWLSMLYPRLRLARDLLTDDGVIFISIDDNEQANLKKICDEVFGESNFVTNIANITGASQNGDGVIFQDNYESCLIYAKQKEGLKINRVDKAEESLRSLSDAPTPLYTRPDMGYTLYFNPITGKIIPQNDYDKSKISTNEEMIVYNNCLDLINDGYIPVRPGMKNGLLHRWRWGYETARERINDIIMQKSGQKWGAYFRQSGMNPPKNIWSFTVGTNQLKQIFEGNKIFDFPKNVKMLQYAIDIATEKDSIILDFFSGSATTAHAVMQLNAEDGGNRKFIMVQLPEPCDEKSEAYKAGYKNICEIGKERIRRAGKKIKEENGLTAQNLDIGFRVLKLDSSNMQDVYYNPHKLTQTLLETTIDNIKPDRTPLDLLFQVMLELGVPLSAKIEEKQVGGKTYYAVNGNDFIACFDNDIDEDVITAIAKEQPLYAAFKDKSFATDSVAINNEQLFKTYSPTTIIKVV